MVLLEGVHAVKHALRFGAELTHLVSWDVAELARLLTRLAPDVKDAVLTTVVAVPPDDAALLAPKGVPSPVIGVAARPDTTAADVLTARGLLLVLEQPRHLGNVGAVIRIAAAVGIGGVLVVGGADPWHPTAVRAGAGLQFALPVARTETLGATTRTLVALDAGGDELAAGSLTDDMARIVGTERGGLSPELRSRCQRRVGLAMRPGVSSLNLATAVAAALYRGH